METILGVHISYWDKNRERDDPFHVRDPQEKYVPKRARPLDYAFELERQGHHVLQISLYAETVQGCGTYSLYTWYRGNP